MHAVVPALTHTHWIQHSAGGGCGWVLPIRTLKARFTGSLLFTVTSIWMRQNAFVVINWAAIQRRWVEKVQACLSVSVSLKCSWEGVLGYKETKIRSCQGNCQQNRTLLWEWFNSRFIIVWKCIMSIFSLCLFLHFTMRGVQQIAQSRLHNMVTPWCC